MSKYFKPYEGDRPFVFISYSHQNSETVLETITKLKDKRLRLWYDEGIPAGSDWPSNIERHMHDCEAVVFFVSRPSLISPNCLSEIRTALRNENPKPVFFVKLEDVIIPKEDDVKTDSKKEEKTISPEWSKYISNIEELPLLDKDMRVESILFWKKLDRSFYRKWTDFFKKEWIGIIVAFLFMIAAVAGSVALELGMFDKTYIPHVIVLPPEYDEEIPVEITENKPEIPEDIIEVRFPDTQQETAIKRILKKDKSDNVYKREFTPIKELYFCGNMTLNSKEEIDGISFDEEGRLKVGNSTPLEGKITDLSVIGSMVFLERLALIDQPVTSLGKLEELVLLNELYLSGSNVSDVSELASLPSLTKLHLEHTDVKDLSVLEESPSLHEVTVSEDMLPLKWTDDKRFKVILIR
ncbi:MAG: TIR domain-containing protein [Lachnospiraceae bacterium]|nr:TIR domain-containing protein [Lachnospiraceae bacterium]